MTQGPLASTLMVLLLVLIKIYALDVTTSQSILPDSVFFYVTSYIGVEVTFFVCPFNPVFLAYKFYFVEYFIFFLYQWNQFCYHYIPPVQHNLSMTLKRSGIYTLSKIINSQTIRKIYIDII